MKKEIQEMLDALADSTRKGEVTWIYKDDNAFTRRYSTDICTEGAFTNISTKHSYSLKGEEIIGEWSGIHMRDNIFPDGHMYVGSSEYEIEALQDALDEMYPMDIPTIQDVEGRIKKVTKTISLEAWRDNRINEITE